MNKRIIHKNKIKINIQQLQKKETYKQTFTQTIIAINGDEFTTQQLKSVDSMTQCNTMPK